MPNDKKFVRAEYPEDFSAKYQGVCKAKYQEVCKAKYKVFCQSQISISVRAKYQGVYAKYQEVWKSQISRSLSEPNTKNPLKTNIKKSVWAKP